MAEGVHLVPAGSAPVNARREHVILVWLLVILGMLIALVSVFAIWLNRVALETDHYVETTDKLLADPQIQAALSNYLVDELYTRVDVTGELRDQLPEELKPLAPVVASGGREAAVVAAKRAFQFNRVQNLWHKANENVHGQLLLLLDDKGRFLRTTDGTVSLATRPIVIELANRVGLGDRVEERLPADAGILELVRSDELGTAQTAVRALRFMADWLWVFAFLCWGLAIYLARSWRREAVGMIAFSFIAVGVLVIFARNVAGDVIVNDLVKVESNRAAVESAWSIVTSGLHESGISLIVIGVMGVIGTWLAGASRVASAARRAMAPYIARPGLAYGALTVALLIYVWWAPISAARSLLWVVVFSILAVVGLALLRRQTMREYPAAEQPDLAGGVLAWLGNLRNNLRHAPAEAATSQDGDWVSQLERLQALRERGALSEEEFQARKTTLMRAA
jgi:hypothetical protein